MPKEETSDLAPERLDLSHLIKTVRANRCLVIRLDDFASYHFLERADLGRPFTMAVPFGTLEETRTPTLCFIFPKESGSPWIQGYVGVLKRKRRLTALEHGIKVIHCLQLDPPTLKGLVKLITNKRARRDFEKRLASDAGVLSLPPDLGMHCVRAVASRARNERVLQRLSADLSPPRERPASRQIQSDAIKTALEIFGLHTDVTASKLTTRTGRRTETELAEYWVREDPVIQHDARSIPDFELKSSDVTGRALFRHEDEVLEVITANRQRLERVLGVDLIYHNVVQKNLVMVQYKMLDPAPGNVLGSSSDWIYRPDKNLKTEVSRMKRFAKTFLAPRNAYRLNPQMFYLKFVRRDNIGSRAAITLPLEHFEKIPMVRGARSARRVSYRALKGAYLRDDAFFGLIRAGYIGSYSSTTDLLLPLIDALVAGNRAVVVAIQSALLRNS